MAFTACGGAGSDTAGSGQVSIVLAASSASSASALATEDHEGGCPGLQAASVTFSAIQARTLDGTLVDVTIALPATVDLLSLGAGKQATLPAGFLPPGTYDQLVVVMKSVELTFADGTQVAITPPGGGWTAIVQVTQPFTVAANQTTTVTFRFHRDESFGCGMSGWEFHPRFDCDGRD
jgi:hypothetical protein